MSSKHPTASDSADPSRQPAPSEGAEWEAEESEDEDYEAQVKARRRRRMKSRRGIGDDIRELNITAMMDMMTIILVFLLKQYAEQPDAIRISDKLTPPMSSIQTQIEPAVKVTITVDKILVEDQIVVDLGAQGLPLEVQAGGKSPVIPPLFEILQDRASTFKTIEERGGAPFDGELLVIADRATPYRLLTAVLYTAGQAHFGSYRLVVQARRREE